MGAALGLPPTTVDARIAQVLALTGSRPGRRASTLRCDGKPLEMSVSRRTDGSRALRWVADPLAGLDDREQRRTAIRAAVDVMTTWFSAVCSTPVPEEAHVAVEMAERSMGRFGLWVGASHRLAPGLPLTSIKVYARPDRRSHGGRQLLRRLLPDVPIEATAADDATPVCFVGVEAQASGAVGTKTYHRIRTDGHVPERLVALGVDPRRLGDRLAELGLGPGLGCDPLVVCRSSGTHGVQTSVHASARHLQDPAPLTAAIPGLADVLRTGSASVAVVGVDVIGAGKVTAYLGGP